MGESVWTAWGGLLALLLGGCATGPFLDNPVLLKPDAEASAVCENPVYIPLGPPAYGMVWENVLDIMNDYFQIAYSNRYDGRIETFPYIAPGVEQPWKPGSPDCDERLLCTFQSIRYRAVVQLQAADDGGFFVDVKVFRELEDLPRPSRSTAGAAAFRSDNTVERQYEVVDPTRFESNWIPLGREPHLEQEILRRLKECM